MVRPFNFENEDDWEEYKYVEHQLGVLDRKANNVIFIASVLIVITTLTSIFDIARPPEIRLLSSISTIAVLISAGLCARVIWTTWADPDKKILPDLKKLRTEKTHFLHASLIALVVSLVLYLLLLLVGYSTGTPVGN
jgi:cytochrome b561